MKLKLKSILLLSACVLCVASVAFAQTPATNDPPATTSWITDAWNTIKESGITKATNYAIEPYFTYAPNAPKGDKIGGGLFVAYNLSDYAATGLGVDYLGHFSMVSANLELKLPTHPLSFLGGYGTNVSMTYFVLGGAGKPLGGTSSGVAVISDAGAYIGFGHIWGGQFNVGGCWGRWDNAGDYSGSRYHAFLGLSWAF